MLLTRSVVRTGRSKSFPRSLFVFNYVLTTFVIFSNFFFGIFIFFGIFYFFRFLFIHDVVQIWLFTWAWTRVLGNYDTGWELKFEKICCLRLMKFWLKIYYWNVPKGSKISEKFERRRFLYDGLELCLIFESIRFFFNYWTKICLWGRKPNCLIGFTNSEILIIFKLRKVDLKDKFGNN